jgi:hypothetical protein
MPSILLCYFNILKQRTFRDAGTDMPIARQKLPSRTASRCRQYGPAAATLAPLVSVAPKRLMSWRLSGIFSASE